MGNALSNSYNNLIKIFKSGLKIDKNLKIYLKFMID
jgi:hypothetical protein